MQIWYESDEKQLCNNPEVVIDYDKDGNPHIHNDPLKQLPQNLQNFWNMKGFNLHDLSLSFGGTATCGASEFRSSNGD